ncbi:uncharacterized protein [Procambarus clarkii]|uniref:uncharacterized protein isoform X2 n=1 Tax=Procambarus clarkii TaxID=6728 RepID=UPI003742D2ED
MGAGGSGRCVRGGRPYTWPGSWRPGSPSSSSPLPSHPSWSSSASYQSSSCCILEDVVERKSLNGDLLHPNFCRRLVQIGGYYAWRKHDKFTIEEHVVMAPLHYRGRLVTSRNVQEYVSEVVSEPLPHDLPPWRVTVITTCDGGGGETWMVARAHHLLAAKLALPDLLVTAYPDPWRHPATRSLTLLAAPAATTRFLGTAITLASTTAATVGEVCRRWCHEQFTSFKTPIFVVVEEALQAAYKVASEEDPAPVARVLAASLTFISILRGKLVSCISSLWVTTREHCNAKRVWHCCLICVAWGARLWWQCALCVLRLPWTLHVWCTTLCCWVREVRATEHCVILEDAIVEVYWMIRAFVTLPRLVLEEALSTRGATPLMGWLGRRRRLRSTRGRDHSMAVAWSDPVPLSTARGVRGVTGATLTEVLLTASAGAVRDYLRVMGLPVPDEVSCTLPVYSQRWAESGPRAHTPGLVTLALPTGATEASMALHTLRESMGKVQAYPERYLASVWLMRNVAYFLPESLLGIVFRALSARYPVLMSNLAGPSHPITLWGHHLVNIFHWRPPQDGAVLSLCVASYLGRARLGVMGDARVVPNAASLPQAFVTHLNELAVNTGVRLERRSSRSWLPGSSPGTTPTPPPTSTYSQAGFFLQWGKVKPVVQLARRQSAVF